MIQVSNLLSNSQQGSSSCETRGHSAGWIITAVRNIVLSEDACQLGCTLNVSKQNIATLDPSWLGNLI